ncbi:MAG: DUF1735 domain-containing protein [Dysgonamonadaceae bacterium]|nr:DUF1735 domain-containing protein [Dysgonamonadaceae bacterium]
MKMKYLYKSAFICGLLAIAAGVFSCKNSEQDFPDFDYTTGYFPYQYPVRTLILGNYIYDNANDNAHKFVISAAIGGVRENSQDRICRFVVDESLCDNAFFSDDSPILPLPANYYSLSDNEKIVIAEGQLNGGIEVQLTEAFFNDPLAIGNAYVVPLRITGVTDLDTILQGQPLGINADRRIAGDWSVSPKDFTMFAVKFINPYHGAYLYEGQASLSGGATEDSTYRAKFVEENEVVKMQTTGRTTVLINGLSFKSKALTGFFNLELLFDSDEYTAEGGVNCRVQAPQGVAYTITGTGRYAIDAETYGGQKHDAVYLTYTVDHGTFHYAATDKFVFRDKGIVMEVYDLKVKN